VFGSAAAVVFQSAFRLEMHQNNFFLNHFLYQHIKNTSILPQKCGKTFMIFLIKPQKYHSII
jgi:hypothetical protein